MPSELTECRHWHCHVSVRALYAPSSGKSTDFLAPSGWPDNSTNTGVYTVPNGARRMTGRNGADGDAVGAMTSHCVTACSMRVLFRQVGTVDNRKPPRRHRSDHVDGCGDAGEWGKPPGFPHSATRESSDPSRPRPPRGPRGSRGLYFTNS